MDRCGLGEGSSGWRWGSGWCGAREKRSGMVVRRDVGFKERVGHEMQGSKVR